MKEPKACNGEQSDLLEPSYICHAPCPVQTAEKVIRQAVLDESWGTTNSDPSIYDGSKPLSLQPYDLAARLPPPFLQPILRTT